MLVKRTTDIPSSEITDRTLYVNRREFMRLAAGVAAGAAGSAGVLAAGEAVLRGAQSTPHGRRLDGVRPSTFSTSESRTSWDAITTYNNFYEFGTDKDSPAEYARNFKTAPWTIAVEGECARKGPYTLDEVLKGETLEERIYRLRCVEAWSMVIPWVGFPLANFVKRCEPTSKARFIELTTLADPAQMPGVRTPVLRWPYVEGLRLDEALHPLTILAVGLYGEVLPNQDGAPIRLVVPWKYGFKSAKSIVKIRFVENQPVNTWQLMTPREYGFYANVNPTVDHPRWSQASERRIGEFFKRKTLMFNGYGDQVASLYSGMDLRRSF
jgi:methionine sulfoxide reductase catalytic subunit